MVSAVWSANSSIGTRATKECPDGANLGQTGLKSPAVGLPAYVPQASNHPNSDMKILAVEIFPDAPS